MMRVVVAAFGNELRGDDGFGIAVLRRIEASGRPQAHVTLLEVGTAGLTLAQELLTPCDRLIVIDGNPFTWEQAGHRLMTFEGFTLEASVKDTIEVLGDRDARGVKP
ncbi:MAG: hydrogenase maturation protease [Acidobacteria bacterium]|nr:hydrogenase maturation protease [Acidobacteriota bacterium]